MEEKLSLKQLIWIGTGHVIGAGVVSIVGSAIAVTGYSVWLAFAVACLLSFIRILPVIFFNSAVIAEGGRYGMITRCAGQQYGGLITLSSLLNWSARGTAVVALGGYILDYLPAVNSKAVTLAVWTVFCIANLYGINMMSRIQSIATPLLLAALALFSAACIFNMQNNCFDFSSEYMFTGGSRGFFTTVVLLSYSCDGIASLANYSTQTENPLKNIPLAMIAVSGITTVIYILVGIASIAVLPLDKISGRTLIVTAEYVLPPFMFNLFVLCGPVMALVTTMNAGIPDSALPVMAGVKEGWLPQWLAKQNRYGAYYVSVIIIYIIGAMPVLLDFSVAQIASITMVLSRLAAVLLIVSAVNFPFVFKKQWERSFMHIPLPVYFLSVIRCAVIEMFVVVKALRELTPGMVVLNIILLVACVGYGIVKMKQINNNSENFIK
ncbi:MAG: APC family permease [Oscillospiraceae bacterium]|nr:APC family permease [Oscillospiraceae bacterium]